MKKIKEPQLKVIKFEAMDIIATSNGGQDPVNNADANTASISYNNAGSWE